MRHLIVQGTYLSFRIDNSNWARPTLSLFIEYLILYYFQIYVILNDCLVEARAFVFCGYGSCLSV
jgi:hypothetical protein